MKLSSRRTARSLAIGFVLYMVMTFASPFLPAVNAATIGLDQSKLAQYEIMQQWKKETKDGTTEIGWLQCLVGMFDRDTDNRAGFARSIAVSDYDDSSFYGYFYGPQNSTSDINVSSAADQTSGGDGKDGRIRCSTAANYIIRTLFGDRKKALDAMYDKTKIVNNDDYPSRHTSMDAFLDSEIDKWLAKIQQDPDWTDSYNIYRNEQIKHAFERCYTVKSGRDEGFDKYSEANYDKKHDNMNTGWAAEAKVEGIYTDGKSNCSDLLDYVFANKLLDASQESEQSIRERAVRAEIISNPDYQNLMAACIGAAGTQASKLNSKSADEALGIISKWLGAGGDGAITFSESTGGSGSVDVTIPAADSKKIKDCMLQEDVFGAELAEVLDAEITAAPDNSSAEEKVLGDCEFDNPDWKGAWRIDKWVSGALDWFGCVVAKAMISILDTLTKSIGDMLETNVNDKQEEALQGVWSRFLTFANVLFVIAFLVMILSTALDLGIFDAYTVKKLLPRILIAVVLANLSFFFTQFLIGATNELGQGMKDIILAPVSSLSPPKMNLGADFGVALTAIMGGLITAMVVAVSTGSIFVLIPALLTAAFGIMVGFLVILVRRIIITVLIVIAPIAIALWVIPGTEGWAKRWWKTFIQMLMVYPIIMALLAAGQFTCAIIIDGRASEDLSFWEAMSAFAVLIIPYLALPTVFKMASSTLSNITGMMNNKGKGVFDKGSNWARERAKTTDKAFDKQQSKDIKVGARKRRGSSLAVERIAKADPNSFMGKYRHLRGLEDRDIAQAEFAHKKEKKDTSAALVNRNYNKYFEEAQAKGEPDARKSALDRITADAKNSTDAYDLSAASGFLADQKHSSGLDDLQKHMLTQRKEKDSNGQLVGQKLWDEALGDSESYAKMKALSPHLIQGSSYKQGRVDATGSPVLDTNGKQLEDTFQFANGTAGEAQLNIQRGKSVAKAAPAAQSAMNKEGWQHYLAVAPAEASQSFAEIQASDVLKGNMKTEVRDAILSNSKYIPQTVPQKPTTPITPTNIPPGASFP